MRYFSQNYSLDLVSLKQKLAPYTPFIKINIISIYAGSGCTRDSGSAWKDSIFIGIYELPIRVANPAIFFSNFGEFSLLHFILFNFYFIDPKAIHLHYFIELER